MTTRACHALAGCSTDQGSPSSRIAPGTAAMPKEKRQPKGTKLKPRLMALAKTMPVVTPPWTRAAKRPLQAGGAISAAKARARSQHRQERFTSVWASTRQQCSAWANKRATASMDFQQSAQGVRAQVQAASIHACHREQTFSSCFPMRCSLEGSAVQSWCAGVRRGVPAV